VPGLGPLDSQYYSAVAAALTGAGAADLGAHTQEFYKLFEQEAAAISSTRDVRRICTAESLPRRHC
jgi:hypothetical protein